MIEELKEQIISVLRTVFDPEIPVNIYDLGLIYDIKINPESYDTEVIMTLTSPNCPAADYLLLAVETSVYSVNNGIKKAKVTLVWDPPWSLDRVPDFVKLELGLF